MQHFALLGPGLLEILSLCCSVSPVGGEGGGGT